MQPITRFSLEKHKGPYDKWPSKTRLFLDGAPTKRKVPGYEVQCQFVVGQFYLLILNWDCPFEETYEIILLRQDLSIASRRSDPPSLFGALALFAGALEVSARNLYSRYEILDERSVRLLAYHRKPPHLRIEVHERRPFGVGSLLALQHETS